MMEKFTARSRKVLILAHQDAQRYNHEYVGTEHLLMGLIQEGSGIACNVLRNLNLSIHQIGAEIEKIVKPGPDLLVREKLPQSPRLKLAIEFALDEATKIGHKYVGTEHLLLGLLRVAVVAEESVSTQVLLNLGVKAEAVRNEVLLLLGHMSVEETEQDRALPKAVHKVETTETMLDEIARLAGEAIEQWKGLAEALQQIKVLAQKGGEKK